ncbi:Uncharacterised protein [Enterobacter kobei]|nr:Uncharacterised protein [Enterobacter kobei]
MRCRDQLTFKGCSFDLKFCIRFRELFEQTSSSARVFHRVCNQGRTNKRVFQALERSTFNYATQQGVTNNTHVYASFTTCFTQFSHFVYSNATGIRNYCRQRAFGYFADFSNNRLFVLKI